MLFLESLLAILNEMSPYILLGFFIAGLLHAFVKPSVMSRHLAGNGLMPVLKAAMFGIPLPLCSCGVLPTAVSLKRNGASNAAATSFLIATPQTGVDSIAATYSLLGLAMAVMRPLAALVCSVLGGVAVGTLAPSEEVLADDEASDCQDDACHDDCCHDGCCEHEPNLIPNPSSLIPDTLWHKLLDAIKYGFVDMIEHVGKWLVIGLVVAALITVFVPDDLFVSLARYPLLAMLVMVAVAVPMYICATGSIPIALSLMMKGLTPGVAFVLLMAGPAANFASVMVLRRSLGSKATTIYIMSVVLTAIASGLIIDYVLPAEWFALSGGVGGVCCEGHTFSIFDTICSAVLVSLLFYALVVKGMRKPQTVETEKATRLYRVTGMMCGHCRDTVQKGLEALPGAESVMVDLGKSTAEIAGDVAPETVIACIHSLGYEAAIDEQQA